MTDIWVVLEDTTDTTNPVEIHGPFNSGLEAEHYKADLDAPYFKSYCQVYLLIPPRPKNQPQ